MEWFRCALKVHVWNLNQKRNDCMKMSKSVLSVLTVGMLAAGSAYGGPPVAVTFKNLGTADATYTIITNNEATLM